MYLVVYIHRARVFVAIPENRLNDMENLFEKFLNSGINSNQLHICYWTDSAAARNEKGEILLNYAPNFNASFITQFPEEGCYLCKIVKAKCEFSHFFGFFPSWYEFDQYCISKIKIS